MPAKMTFEDWQKAVNAYMVKLCGLGINDLPDFYYYDYYMDEIPPLECAKDAIEHAKGY